MNLEEEFARVMYEAPAPGETEPAVWPPNHPDDVAWWVSRAEAVMPLVKRAQADELRKVGAIIRQYAGTELNASSAADIIDELARQVEIEGAGADEP